jgi:hypothetical protein
MPRKYREGQKVKILEVKDSKGKLKYPEIQEYIDRVGTIVKGFDVRMSPDEKFEDYPSYQIEIDDGEMTKVPVPEEAISKIK